MISLFIFFWGLGVFLPTQASGAIGLFGYGDADGLVGQDFLDELGPLYEAEVATIEIVFVAHVVDFL